MKHDRIEPEHGRDTTKGRGAGRQTGQTPDDELFPTTAERIGEGAGGLGGAAAGAAVGSLAGPVGTVIGGLAGAIGGWWAGKEIGQHAGSWNKDDDDFYRSHYEKENRLADRSYDDARVYYQIGHIAGRNPEYRDREFEEVERDLERGWTEDVRKSHGEWKGARGAARAAYQRSKLSTQQGGAAHIASGGLGGTGSVG